MPKNSVFNQPGIEKLAPECTGDALPIAVKVTGRNMHAVALIASLGAEKAQTPVAVAAYFNADGSLSGIDLMASGEPFPVKAGEYLVLDTDRSTLHVLSKGDVNAIKAAVKVIDILIDSVNGTERG